MAPKIIVVILAIGAIGSTLLVARQARLQVVHELTAVRARLAEADRTQCRLRIAVARRTTPRAVEHLVQRLQFETVPTAVEPAPVPPPVEASQIAAAVWPGGAWLPLPVLLPDPLGGDTP